MEKLSPSVRKLVRSLHSVKGRREHGLFITERTKNIKDLLESSFVLRYLIATHEWFDNNEKEIPSSAICLQATRSELERITTLNTPSDVMGVFEIPSNQSEIEIATDSLTLALDAVQDPGNMGTIIRLADWFGVSLILAGEGCVDVYNPKTVIASMGSIGRVKVVECSLTKVLGDASRRNIPVWGTFLNGENIYTSLIAGEANGVIVMGNEGNGISNEVSALVTKRISIPSFNSGNSHAESLNVAMASAIVLSEFRRNALHCK